MSGGAVFGQYVPVDSVVHRLDARSKMAAAAAFTVALFLIDDYSGLALSGLGVALAVRVARVPGRIALRGVRTVSLLLAFTLLANALRWGTTGPALVRLGRLAVDAEGLTQGLFFAARIVLLVVGTSLVTLTTTPVELADGLERVMRPLRRLRVPVDDLAMMLSIALRFVPTTATEAERVVLAQRSRGAKFDSGGPIARARAYIPVLVPLFVNLFRRAEELATAMEARCYRGGPGRTRLHEPRMSALDWAVVVLVPGALALMAVRF